MRRGATTIVYLSICLFIYLSIFHTTSSLPRGNKSLLLSHTPGLPPPPFQAPSIPVPQNFNVVAREGEYTDVQINLQPFLPKEYLQYLKSIISKVISKVKIYLSSQSSPSLSCCRVQHKIHMQG